MSTKLLGFDIKRVTTTAIHELGLIVQDNKGGVGTVTESQFLYPRTAGEGGGYGKFQVIKEFSADAEYKYVRAQSAVAIGDSVRLDTGQTDEPAAVIPVSATDQPIEGVAVVAIASGSFGFVQVRGRVPAQAAGTADATARYGAKLAAAGAAGDMKGSGATGNMATLSSADATDATNQGRTIIQLDTGIDDGSTTQFRAEVYIY